MRKCICDKCGKEAEFDDTVEIQYGDWPDDQFTYDLCDDCMKLLYEFLTGWTVTGL